MQLILRGGGGGGNENHLGGDLQAAFTGNKMPFTALSQKDVYLTVQEYLKTHPFIYYTPSLRIPVSPQPHNY